MSGTPFSYARLVLGALCETVTTAPPDSQLTGTWRLDKSASDDPDAKVAKVFAAAQSKLRHSLSRYNYHKDEGGEQTAAAGHTAPDAPAYSFDTPGDRYG